MSMDSIDADQLPDCLRWPDDPVMRLSMAKSLPSNLFAQLRSCLKLAQPPDAELFRAAWDQRPQSLQDAIKQGHWIDAYAEASQNNSSLEDHSITSQSYISACRSLLLGEERRVAVPVVTVDGNKRGRVQQLHIHAVAAGHSALHVHPEYVWQEPRADASFLTGLANAWKLASAEATQTIQAFWHLSETDGKPPPSTGLLGSSASGAAFRVFWHLMRGLCLDEAVMVLTSVSDEPSSLNDVADLGPKLEAIRSTHVGNPAKEIPTIVIAVESAARSAQDSIAITQAESWAVVHQVANCAELAAVRSCESIAAIAYLTYLAKALDECRLLPMGKRLSEVHVPPQVWKDERIRPEHEAGWRDESENDAASGPEHRDSPPTKRRVRQPWERVFHLHRGRSPLVLVGGPGSGKSTVLHWTAREMARASVIALQARSCQPAEVSWPVLVNLDTWAAHEQRQQPRASLVSLITGAVPEEMAPHERSAITRLIEQRLTTATQQTCLFLDSLDQVASGRVDPLRKRLASLSDLTTRLVLTTRESGLRTHEEAMKTLPSPIKVESAPLTPEDTRTLAAKWLGQEQAARLERHLRSYPSLGIVADSPLLLTLACLVTSEQPDQTLPETPAALYQEMTRLLAQGRWRNGDDAPPASHDPQALLDQLPGIAWRLFVRSPGVNRFDRNTMLDAIGQITGRKGEARAEFLDHQLVEFGFVEASESTKAEPRYEFRHITLLEFLVARHLAEVLALETWNSARIHGFDSVKGWTILKLRHWLEANVWNETVWSVLEFMCGIGIEALPLVRILTDRNNDDLQHTLLTLACRFTAALPDRYGSLAVYQCLHRRREVLAKLSDQLGQKHEKFGEHGQIRLWHNPFFGDLERQRLQKRTWNLRGGPKSNASLLWRAAASQVAQMGSRSAVQCFQSIFGSGDASAASPLVDGAVKLHDLSILEAVYAAVGTMKWLPGEKAVICTALLKSGVESIVESAASLLLSLAEAISPTREGAEIVQQTWELFGTAHEEQAWEITKRTLNTPSFFCAEECNALDQLKPGESVFMVSEGEDFDNRWSRTHFAYLLLNTLAKKKVRLEFTDLKEVIIAAARSLSADDVYLCILNCRNPDAGMKAVMFVWEMINNKPISYAQALIHLDLARLKEEWISRYSARFWEAVISQEGDDPYLLNIAANVFASDPQKSDKCEEAHLLASRLLANDVTENAGDLSFHLPYLLDTGYAAEIAPIAQQMAKVLVESYGRKLRLRWMKEPYTEKILSALARTEEWPRVLQFCRSAVERSPSSMWECWDAEWCTKAICLSATSSELKSWHDRMSARKFSSVARGLYCSCAELLRGMRSTREERIQSKYLRFYKDSLRIKQMKILQDELLHRGWSLRLRRRKIEVLRRGQDEPRADADFGC